MGGRWDQQRGQTPPAPAKRRGFHWCRLDNHFLDMPLWRAVAKKAKVPLSQVLCVVLRLELLANQSVPRGSVADMSVPEFAASLQISPNAVARIRVALEEPDIAWVDQDTVVNFCLRNPDMNDPHATERQRRRRARLKEERERSQAAMLGDHSARGPPEFSTFPHVTRDTVTVTRDVTPDQIRSESTAACGKLAGASVRADAPPGLSEKESGNGTAASDSAGSAPPEGTVEKHDAASLQLWLAEGERIVTERLEVTLAQARTKLARWREALGGDVLALAAIIRAADATDWVGARFHNLVVDQIRRRREEAKGAPLPLPPVATKREAG